MINRADNIAFLLLKLLIRHVVFLMHMNWSIKMAKCKYIDDWDDQKVIIKNVLQNSIFISLSLSSKKFKTNGYKATVNSGKLSIKDINIINTNVGILNNLLRMQIIIDNKLPTIPTEHNKIEMIDIILLLISKNFSCSIF